MKPPAFRFVRNRIRKGLAATVARLDATLTEKLGRSPTDEEMAALLALSVGSIRKARGRSGGKA